MELNELPANPAEFTRLHAQGQFDHDSSIYVGPRPSSSMGSAINGCACFQCLFYHGISCVFISYNVCHVIKAESGAQQLNLCQTKALQQHMLCYQGVGRIAAQFVIVMCGWMINLIMTAQSMLA